MTGYVSRLLARHDAKRLSRRAARKNSVRKQAAADADTAALLAELERLEELQAAIDREMSVRLADFDDGDDIVEAVVMAAGRPPGPETVRPRPAKAEKMRVIPRLPATPVIPVSRSVSKDGIVCLIDGVRRKMLHRHLKTKYGITPEEYRKHFGLPGDYPMTAPGYSASQSKAVTAAIADGRVPGRSIREKA